MAEHLHDVAYAGTLKTESVPYLGRKQALRK
jgi:hypothetical protein